MLPKYLGLDMLREQLGLQNDPKLLDVEIFLILPKILTKILGLEILPKLLGIEILPKLLGLEISPKLLGFRNIP